MTDKQLIHLTNYVKEKCLVGYLNKYGKQITIIEEQGKAVIGIPRFVEGQIVELKFINTLAEAIKEAFKFTEIHVNLNR